VSNVCHLPDPLIPILSLKIIHNSHLTRNATKIPLMHSFSGNCAASVPFSTFMCPWAIYIFPWSVHIFGCSKLDRPILEINKSLTYICVQELGDRALQFCFRNKEDAHCTVSFLGIHKWQTDIYIRFSPALHLQWNLSFIWNKNAIFRSHSPAAPSGPAATAVETPTLPESKVKNCHGVHISHCCLLSIFSCTVCTLCQLTNPKEF
jgi:hypothetical protein